MHDDDLGRRSCARRIRVTQRVQGINFGIHEINGRCFKHGARRSVSRSSSRRWWQQDKERFGSWRFTSATCLRAHCGPVSGGLYAPILPVWVRFSPFRLERAESPVSAAGEMQPKVGRKSHSERQRRTNTSELKNVIPCVPVTVSEALKCALSSQIPGDDTSRLARNYAFWFFYRYMQHMTAYASRFKRSRLSRLPSSCV